MRDSDLRERVRARLHDGTLQHNLPMVQPGQQVISTIALVRDMLCSVCGGADPRMKLQYPAGAFYFHNPCYQIWDDERSAPTPSTMPALS